MFMVEERKCSVAGGMKSMCKETLAEFGVVGFVSLT